MRKNNTHPNQAEVVTGVKENKKRDSFIEALFYAIRIATDEDHKRSLADLAFEIIQKKGDVNVAIRKSNNSIELKVLG